MARKDRQSGRHRAARMWLSAKDTFARFFMRGDRLAILISLLALAAAGAVAHFVYEDIPHVEDEMAYVWQAQVFARGELSLASPPAPKSMLVPFVVDYNGRRFGKYPPAWPVMLSYGIRMGARAWVNPLLAGLAVWLTYRLGRKLFDRRIALIAIGLMSISPFFLLLSGSLLSHPWSLTLSLIFTLAWLDLFLPGAERVPPAGLLVPVAGLSLGAMALTRPLSAVAVALPFFCHGLWLLWRGDRAARLRVIAIGLIAGAAAALLLAWQYALTGDAFLNPYVLWWPYDRIGFGADVGRMPGGHSLTYALRNLSSDLGYGASDLFGWRRVSWLLLPAGLWAARRERRVWLTLGVFAGLALAYLLYWVGARLYGPRYYYEALPLLALLSAAGWCFLRERARVLPRGRILSAAIMLSFAALIVSNLAFYLPGRLRSMTGLYGISRADMDPFTSQAALAAAPGLVIVHPQRQWTEYGGLLELQDAWLSTPFIFAYTRGPEADAGLAVLYQDRRVWHYYPAEPFVLLPDPK